VGYIFSLDGQLETMYSFKDFITVNYTNGQTEMQDLYAWKRHHGLLPEEGSPQEAIEKHREDSRAKQKKNIESLHGKANQP